MEAITLNLRDARQQVIRCISADLVPLVVGPPGMGKSAMVHDICNEFNLELIDIRLTAHDPADMNGYPMPDRASGKTCFLPIDLLPVEGDELPKGKDGWFVFLDELTSVDEEMQGAAYKLILDRMVGNKKLHPRVRMAAAGNREQDGAIARSLSTALQSRMIHFEVHSDPEAWLSWAEKNGIDWRITGYINHAKAKLNTFDPAHEDKTFACERTWHMVSKLIANEPDLPKGEFMPLVAGTIGMGVASEFLTYNEIKSELPTIKEIMTDPDNAKLPDNPSAVSGVSALIAAHTELSNLKPLMAYTKRLNPEMQFVTVRSMFRRNEDILNDPSMLDWVSQVSQEYI